MTQTLTTETIKQWRSDAENIARRSCVYETEYSAAEAILALTAELLANREAQPVAELVYSSAMPRFIGDTNEIEGYRCWIHGETRLVPTMEQAYADAKAVCTAPPTPAVPEEMTGGIAMSKYKVKKSNYVQWVKGWNACRAAMLAQPVSQRYTLPPHAFRELVNSLRDTAVKYQGTQQLREQLSRTLRENGLLAAAPEGGNHNPQ